MRSGGHQLRDGLPPALLRWLVRAGLGVGFLGPVIGAFVLRAVQPEGPSLADVPPVTVRPVMMHLPLPEGPVTLGSPASDSMADEDEPLRTVRITQPFAIAQTEVTQAQYEAVMGDPIEVDGCRGFEDALEAGIRKEALVGPDLPAICVSWFDAIIYANRLSEGQGLEACYAEPGDRGPSDAEPSDAEPSDGKPGDGEAMTFQGITCEGYRLPTEAEWEYAARAWGTDRYAGTDVDSSLCDYANIGDQDFIGAVKGAATANVFAQQAGLITELGLDSCADGWPGLMPVGEKKPNPWGLFDLSGNVWEWTQDWYDAQPPGDDVGNSLGPDRGKRRVVRGGSWSFNPLNVRVAYRSGVNPSGRIVNQGFRVSRSFPLPSAIGPLGIDPPGAPSPPRP